MSHMVVFFLKAKELLTLKKKKKKEIRKDLNNYFLNKPVVLLSEAENA